MGKLGKILGGIALGVGGLIAAGTAVETANRHRRYRRHRMQYSQQNNDNDDDNVIVEAIKREEKNQEENLEEQKQKLSSLPELETYSCGTAIGVDFAITIFVVVLAIALIAYGYCDKVWTIVLVVLGLLVFYTISFFVGLLVYKNRVTEAQEKISELKSETRIAKARYVQRASKIMEFTKEANESQGEALKSANQGGVNFMGAGHINNNYKESIDLSKDLFNHLNLYQSSLTTVIKKYNVFIRKFPNSIYSKILKLEPESYVANDSLDKSLDIGQDEFL